MRPQKKIDESWKNEVEKEKAGSAHSTGSTPSTGSGLAGSPRASSGQTSSGQASESGEAGGGMPPVDFMLFLSTLALQAYVALGDAPDPATNERKVHLEQAKYMIDIIGVIEQKTHGNLSAEETQTLSQLLYELRVRFVEKMEGS